MKTSVEGINESNLVEDKKIVKPKNEVFYEIYGTLENLNNMQKEEVIVAIMISSLINGKFLIQI